MPALTIETPEPQISLILGLYWSALCGQSAATELCFSPLVVLLLKAVPHSSLGVLGPFQAFSCPCSLQPTWEKTYVFISVLPMLAVALCLNHLTHLELDVALESEHFKLLRIRF